MTDTELVQACIKPPRALSAGDAGPTPPPKAGLGVNLPLQDICNLPCTDCQQGALAAVRPHPQFPF